MSLLSYQRSVEELEEDEDRGRESLELDLPIQVHSRPVTPAAPPRIDVTDGSFENSPTKRRSFGHSDIDYKDDESILLAAQELGITVPPEPKARLDLSEGNISTLTVSSSVPETNTLQSRTSQSTRPTSFTSSEQHVVQRVHSPVLSSATTTYSLRSPTPSSVAPTTNTSYSKIRKSIRRLSTFGRRLSTAPASPTLTDSDSLAPSMRWTPRPSTARSSTAPRDRQRSAPPPSTTHHMTAMILPSVSESRLSAIYPPSSFSQLPAFMSMTPPPEEPRETRVSDEEALAARERSLGSKRLQKLRLQQLEEQSTFLKFHFDSIDKIRSQHTEERRQAANALKEKREAMQVRHAERNADMETRHLGAEIDLIEQLAAERRACETKLKHMDAYCNNRQSMRPGGPPRKVTESDYRKLVEQYNIRDGMASLHEGRINVLREKQAKQLERIAARQESELQSLQDHTTAELERKEGAAAKEEAELRQEFEFKKDKLIWRWKVMEAIDRRRLELERGEEFGELPDVQWADDGWLKAAL